LRGSLTVASASSKLARPPVNGSAFRSINRLSFLSQQRVIEWGGQDLGGMAVQRAQPHPLRVTVRRHVPALRP
jgi:hypothetical protein